MFMALAVPAEEAKSIAGRRALSSYILPPPVPMLAPDPPVPPALPPVLNSTSIIEGGSNNCWRFLSSVERRLAERLSLDASDVESGELRSMDEAMSVSVIQYTYKFI